MTNETNNPLVLTEKIVLKTLEGSSLFLDYEVGNLQITNGPYAYVSFWIYILFIYSLSLCFEFHRDCSNIKVVDKFVFISCRF